MTIYLEPNEEITSIIDHLIQTEEKQIVLIVPLGAQILQSAINLKLLKREAENLQKKIIIVTQDQNGRRLAAKVGLEIQDNFISDDSSEPEELLMLPEGETMKSSANSPAESTAGEKQSSEEPLVVNSQYTESLGEIESSIESSENRIQLANNFFQKTRREPLKMADIIRPASRRKPISQDELEKSESVKKDASKLAHIKEFKPKSSNSSRQKYGFHFPKEKLFAIFSSFNFKFYLALLIVLLFLGVGLFIWLFLPKAEISLRPRTEQIFIERYLVADKNLKEIDADLDRLPAQLIKIEKSKAQDFITTNERQLNEKARGLITIYNAYSSQPQTLIINTRFVSEGGYVFRTIRNILVPGAQIFEGKIVPSTIDVEVIADEAGAEYNIPAGKFSIPGFKGTAKYQGFYGQSKEPMSGGSTEKVRIVGQTDFDKAKSALLEDLKKEVRQELEEQMPVDLKLIEGATQEEIVQIFSSAQVGEQAEEFNLNIKVALYALVFSEKDAGQLLKGYLNIQIPETKEKINGSLGFNYRELTANFDKGIIKFKVLAQELIANKIDILSFKKLLAGKDETAIKQIFLDKNEIESARIRFWPFWVNKVPQRLDRITITIDYF